MVTSEHMNQLLKNVLNLIKSHVGVEMAPWMTRIAGFTQQIIINTSEELLKDPFLPLAQKIKKRTEQMFHKEEALRGFLKSTVEDTSLVCNQSNQSATIVVENPWNSPLNKISTNKSFLNIHYNNLKLCSLEIQ